MLLRRCFVEPPQMRWMEWRWASMLQRIVVHRYFYCFGNVVAISNVVCIAVELAMKSDAALEHSWSPLAITNLLFILYYFLEQNLRFWAMGSRLFLSSYANIMDATVTLCLMLAESAFLIEHGIPDAFQRNRTRRLKIFESWDMVRVVNILIMLRILRLIPYIKRMALVAYTLLDLIRNLRAFGGVLVACFYVFAIIGVEVFGGKIVYHGLPNATNQSYPCGSYEQLNYWANNFDDFASALVVLWDVMVVNNWHVFLEAYKRNVHSWFAQLYFIIWWLISVIIILNLFTAVIIDNFIMRWDRYTSYRGSFNGDGTGPDSAAPVGAPGVRSRLDSHHATSAQYSVHDMFRDTLKEPTEEQLLLELRHHQHIDFGHASSDRRRRGTGADSSISDLIRS